LQPADPVVRTSWVHEKGMRVFTFVDPSNPMLLADCFAEDVIAFDDLWARSEVMSLASTTVRVASIADLIALKRRAARPHDQQDVEALQDILRRRRHDARLRRELGGRAVLPDRASARSLAGVAPRVAGGSDRLRVSDRRADASGARRGSISAHPRVDAAVGPGEVRRNRPSS
jgi:hypothetical protein